MIDLTMLTSREDLCEITGLPSDNHHKALWDAGFNLDDWDVCFVSEVPLTTHETDEDDYEWYEWDEPIKDAHWLVISMENYCIGYEHVEYGGKHYYMVYHS